MFQALKNDIHLMDDADLTKALAAMKRARATLAARRSSFHSYAQELAKRGALRCAGDDRKRRKENGLIAAFAHLDAEGPASENGFVGLRTLMKRQKKTFAGCHDIFSRAAGPGVGSFAFQDFAETVRRSYSSGSDLNMPPDADSAQGVRMDFPGQNYFDQTGGARKNSRRAQREENDQGFMATINRAFKWAAVILGFAVVVHTAGCSSRPIGVDYNKTHVAAKLLNPSR